MYDKKVLAVIPARGGSKGIKGKNIKDLGGKPLIAYTIEEALKSNLIHDCIVSTDDEKIAKVSREYGADVPFMRPDELSCDKSLSLPVVLHALEFMEKKNKFKYDAVIMLQATTPFKEVSDIDKAIIMLFENDADSVISVVNVDANHPLRMKRIVGNRLINYIDQGYENMRPRQELPPVYIRNGALYLAKRETLLEQNTFSGKNCLALEMPEEKSVNIDTFKDMLLAEYFLNHEKEK